MPVQPDEYFVGLNASTLVADGGTLQIGIGALGDAVAYSCILRQEHNSAYCQAVESLTHQHAAVAGHRESFDKGLYVSTEMFVNGMMQLIEHGVVKRKVYDNLALQTGLNSGAISTTIDERLFESGSDNKRSLIIIDGLVMIL